MSSQANLPKAADDHSCQTGSDERFNPVSQTGSDEDDTSGSDSSQSNYRRENAERPYSPPFERYVAALYGYIQWCAQEGCCVQEDYWLLSVETFCGVYGKITGYFL